MSVPSRRRQAGFTLVELMIATSVSGVLASIAYPSYSGAMHKLRRTEALVSMIQLQQAEERWRANNGRYGSLEEVGVASAIAGGNYRLSVDAASAHGYEATAVATGAQARDAACRYMVLVVVASDVAYRSGATDAADNPAPVNRKCWNL
jgi:type IV pilus assembly protein PilE